MIPKKTVRVGCFDYEIRLYDESTSENHGDTCLGKKVINLFDNKNKQVLQETLQHELFHVLLEDLIKLVKEIEDPTEAEELLIRVLSPRLFQMVNDNKQLCKWIWDL